MRAQLKAKTRVLISRDLLYLYVWHSQNKKTIVNFLNIIYNIFIDIRVFFHSIKEGKLTMVSKKVVVQLKKILVVPMVLFTIALMNGAVGYCMPSSKVSSSDLPKETFTMEDYIQKSDDMATVFTLKSDKTIFSHERAVWCQPSNREKLTADMTVLDGAERVDGKTATKYGFKCESVSKSSKEATFKIICTGDKSAFNRLKDYKYLHFNTCDSDKPDTPPKYDEKYPSVTLAIDAGYARIQDKKHILTTFVNGEPTHTSGLNLGNFTHPYKPDGNENLKLFTGYGRPVSDWSEKALSIGPDGIWVHKQALLALEPGYYRGQFTNHQTSNPEMVTFTVKINGTLTYTKKEGDFEISTRVPKEFAENPLEKATYKVLGNNIDITLNDSKLDGEDYNLKNRQLTIKNPSIANKKYTYTKPASGGTKTGTITADSRGQISFNIEDFGTYSLVEKVKEHKGSKDDTSKPTTESEEKTALEEGEGGEEPIEKPKGDDAPTNIDIEDPYDRVEDPYDREKDSKSETSDATPEKESSTNENKDTNSDTGNVKSYNQSDKNINFPDNVEIAQDSTSQEQSNLITEIFNPTNGQNLISGFSTPSNDKTTYSVITDINLPGQTTVSNTGDINVNQNEKVNDNTSSYSTAKTVNTGDDSYLAAGFNTLITVVLGLFLINRQRRPLFIGNQKTICKK